MLQAAPLRSFIHEPTNTTARPCHHLAPIPTKFPCGLSSRYERAVVVVLCMLEGMGVFERP